MPKNFYMLGDLKNCFNKSHMHVILSYNLAFFNNAASKNSVHHKTCNLVISITYFSTSNTLPSFIPGAVSNTTNINMSAFMIQLS